MRTYMVCMYLPSVCLWRPEKSIRFPETEDTNNCELLYGCWDQNTYIPVSALNYWAVFPVPKCSFLTKSFLKSYPQHINMEITEIDIRKL